MNPAAEHIIRWHLDQHQLSSSETEQVVATLKTKLSRGDADARQAAEGLISRALEATKLPPDDQIIPMMYDLHREYETLAEADRQLEAQIVARHIYEARVQTPLGERIAVARIKATLGEYGLELSLD